MQNNEPNNVKSKPTFELFTEDESTLIAANSIQEAIKEFVSLKGKTPLLAIATDSPIYAHIIHANIFGYPLIF